MFGDSRYFRRAPSDGSPEPPFDDGTQTETWKPQLQCDDIEQIDTARYIWLVAVTASIGGGLFGYDTGIISAVLVYLSDSLGHVLSSSEKELVTALCSAGAFMGSIIAGMRADRYGRKGFATDL